MITLGLRALECHWKATEPPLDRLQAVLYILAYLGARSILAQGPDVGLSLPSPHPLRYFTNERTAAARNLVTKFGLQFP